ncbi:MAG: hypothetical protein ACREO9_09315, partial [Lysobacterales bacterium]
MFWLLLPLTLYLVMRAYALAPPELRSTDQIDESAAYATSFEPENIGPAAGGAKLSATFDMMEFPGSRTVLKVAGVLGGSMKIIAWPYPLHLFNDEPSTLMSVVYLVLHVLLVIVSLVQLRRKRYGLAAGLGFFYIAMLPASRIVGDGGLGPHIAERYVYFPSVGLAILLAFAFRALTHRFGPRILLGFVAPILLVMIALTLDRNADWVNDVSLLGTEYESGARNISTLRLTTSAYLKAGFPERVVEICDENVAAQDQFGDSTFVQHCATAYGSQHRDEEEERAYLFAIQHETTRVAASMALARFY